jgi:uncharacterized protein (TIGR01319 family)
MKGILIDFGSTFTKVIVVDVETGKLLARSKSASTVRTDVTIGLRRALSNIGLELSDLKRQKFDYKLSCSSAAGGLRMVSIGLVPQFTVEAAKKAALGAGANVLEVYAYDLTSDELKRIEAQNPDIILLVGGCDGGDRETVLHNAYVLSSSGLTAPIVIGCNKDVSEEVAMILKDCGKDVRTTENVMPELWELNIEPAKEEIRKVFLEKIVDAKGLDKIKNIVDVLMPTPSATLKAVELLAEGTENNVGFGHLLTIEVGGATTNVYSVSEGVPTRSNTILRGFKEPYVKRTVEGDLGLRHNANSILDKAGERKFMKKLCEEELHRNLDIYARVQYLCKNISFIPKSDEDFAVDAALARAAVEIAVERHSGRLTELKFPAAISFIQKGKDLTNVENVIGTGGGIVYEKHPNGILSEALFDPTNPFVLKPKNPKLWIDKNYVFWAMGLLADIVPDTAIAIMKRSLTIV